MPKTILILAANPKDTPQLRLDEEIREIDNGLERAKKRDEFVLKQKLAARSLDVRRAMLDHKPAIVHFCGHGAGEEGIAFEDDDGKAELIGAEALAGFFEVFADTLECVVLNACYSEVQADAISKHIPCVIGMNKAIGDKAAIIFSVAFYDAIGAGESFEFAYKLACNSMLWTRVPENLTPVLKLHARTSSNSGSGGNRSESRPDSDRLEELASSDADTERIKALIRERSDILHGIPQYFAGSPIVENLPDLPMPGNLSPDFTRFLFQPRMSQIANYILFIDFLSPKDSVFLDGLQKSPAVEKGEMDVRGYMENAKGNYLSFCKTAIKVDSFKIPLSTLQNYMFVRMEGVLVAGRRKYLTIEQLESLSKPQRDEGIKIITYDALIEYSKSRGR